jgi:putative GTP pyrophosphokinase
MSLDLAGEIRPVFVEIQIRTIAMDFWSSLEHQMKYKKDIQNQELIAEELKRCADQIATTDLNMQTIRKMINNEE